nr:hypothetical protein [Bacteroidota bacterium]
MKTRLLILIMGLISVFSHAQAPQTFSYQAVARDNSGNVLANTNVSFQIGVLQSSASGTIVYSETHNSTTNGFGSVNLEIGNGIVVSGVFSDIDWGNSNYFLQVEMDETGGTNYQLMGTTQLLSVPYALHAETTANPDDGDWTLSGNDMYSTVTGNVGIGTTSPTYRLHVTGSGSSPVLNVHNTGWGRGLRVYTTSACAIWVEKAGNHGLRVTQANGNGVNITNANGNGIHVAQAGGYAGYFNGSGYFAGNVGIGEFWPAAKLEVNGNIIADYPTLSNHVATKQYVDDQLIKYENIIRELEASIEKLNKKIIELENE